MMSSQDPSPDEEAIPQSARDKMLLGFVTERESEFNRISRFLHDDVGQVLSAVGLHLDALRLDYRTQAPGLEQRTNEIQEILETVIGRIRDLSNELNPSAVQRTGLQYAVDRLFDRLRETFSGSIRVQLDPVLRVPPAQAEGMYRGTEAAVELFTTDRQCTQLDVQLKRSRDAFILEMRGNVIIELEQEPRFPALLMTYYAHRNGVALTVNRVDERDTIIKFSCPTTGPDAHRA